MSTTKENFNVVCPICSIKIPFNNGSVFPEEEDIALCYNCKSIFIFKNDLTLRIPDQNELDEIMSGEFSEILLDILKLPENKKYNGC